MEDKRSRHENETSGGIAIHDPVWLEVPER